MNALASVIRGSGNMGFPSLVVCVGVALLVPLSPLLIFGLGPFPALGIAGGGVAVVATTALMTALLALVRRLRRRPRAPSPRAAALGSVRRHPARRRRRGRSHAADDADRRADDRRWSARRRARRGRRLRHGLAARISADPARLRPRRAARRDGRRQYRRRANAQRALRIAADRRGASPSRRPRRSALAAAVWPRAWLGLFGDDPGMLATGSAYLALRRAGLRLLRPRPVALFRLAGRGPAAWPLLGGLLRLVIAVAGGAAGSAADGIAGGRVRDAGAGAGGLRRDRRRRGALGGVARPAEKVLRRRPMRFRGRHVKSLFYFYN